MDHDRIREDILKDAANVSKMGDRIARSVRSGNYQDAAETLDHLMTSFLPVMKTQVQQLRYSPKEGVTASSGGMIEAVLAGQHPATVTRAALREGRPLRSRS